MAGVAVAAQGVSEPFRRLDEIAGELRGEAVEVGLHRIVASRLACRLTGARDVSRGVRAASRPSRSRSLSCVARRRTEPAQGRAERPDAARRQRRPRDEQRRFRIRRAWAGRKRARVAATERDRRRRPDERRHLRRRPPPRPRQQSGRLVDGAELREQQGGPREQTRLVGDGARGALRIGARRSSVSRPALALRPREQARRFDRGRPPGPGADRRAVRRRVAVARGQLDLVRAGAGRADRRATRRSRPRAAGAPGRRCRGRAEPRRAPPGKRETQVRRRSPRRRPARPPRDRHRGRGPGRARRADRGSRARRRPRRRRCARPPPGRRFGR